MSKIKKDLHEFINFFVEYKQHGMIATFRSQNSFFHSIESRACCRRIVLCIFQQHKFHAKTYVHFSVASMKQTKNQTKPNEAKQNQIKDREKEKNETENP